MTASWDRAFSNTYVQVELSRRFMITCAKCITLNNFIGHISKVLEPETCVSITMFESALYGVSLCLLLPPVSAILMALENSMINIKWW